MDSSSGNFWPRSIGRDSYVDQAAIAAAAAAAAGLIDVARRQLILRFPSSSTLGVLSHD